jgi:hypothetical protein
MTDFVIDTMTGRDWDDIDERSGELGTPWVRHPSTPSTRWYLFGGRVHCGVAGVVYAAGEPATADYTVASNLVLFGTVTIPRNLNLGLAGRIGTSQDTYYALYYQAGELVLMKRVAGVTTTLDVEILSLTGGGTVYQWSLVMAGTSIKGFLNGVERVAATDADITAKGRGGLRSFGINDAGTGSHIDNFNVYDATVPVAAAGQSRGQIVGL